ncbi:hypothetical protein DFH08DRAFT_938354 [Mycena albidolilacea]|uniref:Zn(2)-C6 fungal-type domain-containing protein n=1 Tax=Mycena albidolilacea TaxID=1033008 RepID=A0AAD7ENS8_9AGAR|nr:hypothetical protein DFH08DRAFT_938354 [Mycena albidolilacea]
MPQETLQLPSFRELTAALRCEEWDPITGVSANDPPAVDGHRAGRAPLPGLNIPSGAFASASTSSKAGTEKRRYNDADADSLLMLGRPYPNSQASSSSSPMSPASTSAHTPSISAPIFPHHSLDQNRLTLPAETPPTPQYPYAQKPQQIQQPYTYKFARTKFALGGEPQKKQRLSCFFCRQRKIACSRQEQAPGEDGEGEAEPCTQCTRRHLQCRYPAVSWRGQHRMRAVRTGLGADSNPASPVSSNLLAHQYSKNPEPTEYPFPVRG